MEKEVKLVSVRKRKIFLILTKYIPHLIGILYVVYTILCFLEIDSIAIGYIASISVLPWLHFYSASWALEFCYVHRLPLYYILIDEILLVTDNYLCIPLNVYNLFMLHLLIIGLLIFGYTYYYIKHKNRMANFIKRLGGPCTPVPGVNYDNHLEEQEVVETRLVITYNVSDASQPTQLHYYSGSGPTIYSTDIFDEIEVDGTNISVSDLNVAEGKYQLSIGEHIVKFTLKDPTSIASWLFGYKKCTNITNVNIPNSVTTINAGAFNNCINLTNINIPNSVTSIGNNVFASCSSLTNITIPNDITSIGDSAFLYCSGLTSIVIPSGVTSIKSSIFQGCTGLTSVTIGSGVTSIGNYAFNGCSSLTSIVSNATTAPTITSSTFRDVKTDGTLTVPTGSTGYDVWMDTGDYYLGLYNWTKVEQ